MTVMTDWLLYLIRRSVCEQMSFECLLYHLCNIFSVLNLFSTSCLYFVRVQYLRNDVTIGENESLSCVLEFSKSINSRNP